MIVSHREGFREQIGTCCLIKNKCNAYTFSKTGYFLFVELTSGEHLSEVSPIW